MSLWTPYAQEAALDLSKPVVKIERRSPDLPVTNSSPPVSGYVYPTTHDNQYYSGYPYPQHVGYTVPSAQISPEPVWPQYQQQKTFVSPSPPNSPDFFDTESLSDDVEYQAFERDALRAMAEKNGGTLLGNNPRMRRAVQTSQAADDSYRKQRERNNYAAKQSRDRRKLREVRLAFQVTYLKKKMAELRGRLAAGVCNRCRQISEC
ncbi:hepatic leukemia factor-like [Manduca sexta]|uniref:BZIP domain-containing protein n=1 Tax=Manduca sexta TaxID=7130 RepID=A0A921ZKE7_MANSE|nr:hepatic leukemia factor-like [Manduca sexta]KAG6459657.1 hypothetical protein O3G_MSEX011504 [Manduca sexta]